MTIVQALFSFGQIFVFMTTVHAVKPNCYKFSANINIEILTLQPHCTMMNTGEISPVTTVKEAGSKSFANDPKTRKKKETLESALFKVQESMARAITTTQGKWYPISKLL